MTMQMRPVPEADSPGLEAIPIMQLVLIMQGLRLSPGLERSPNSRFGCHFHHHLSVVACPQASQLHLVVPNNLGQGVCLLTEQTQ